MPDESKRTIFIIDDDASVCKALSRLLRSSGFQVETFLSGEQFLARKPFHGLGCILVDIQLSEMSGMVLQRELIKAGYRHPIIFVTGHGDASTRLQAMQQGAFDFLTKPIDGRDLLRSVESAFEREELREHA
jgi:FixJ family two-component response regulator